LSDASQRQIRVFGRSSPVKKRLNANFFSFLTISGTPFVSTRWRLRLILSSETSNFPARGRFAVAIHARIDILLGLNQIQVLNVFPF
jgi:hypothetical protein